MEVRKQIRCHKCRNTLFEDVADVISGCYLPTCPSNERNRWLFVNEEKLPDWVKQKIEEEQWTKGKLHCQSCGSKVGSFDFISGRKCICGEAVLPSVHFISSQVDRPLTGYVYNHKSILIHS